MPQADRGGRLWTAALPGWFSRAAEGRLEAAQPKARRSVGSVARSLSVQVPGHVPNGGSHGAAYGAASSEMADATDLGEKMVRQR